MIIPDTLQTPPINDGGFWPLSFCMYVKQTGMTVLSKETFNYLGGV